jgi:hypothetical protein
LSRSIPDRRLRGLSEYKALGNQQLAENKASECASHGGHPWGK